MYQIIKKDLTTVEKGVIAHGVNCRGWMGAGVARQLKNKWPIIHEDYATLCSHNDPNVLMGLSHMVRVNQDLWIANVFTQIDVRKQAGEIHAKPYAIRKGLYDMLEGMIDHKNQWNQTYDIYLPMIGCNLGGLKWDIDVEPIINDFSRDVHEYGGKTYVCIL